MDYQIALSPEIDVDVEEFVSAWNNEDKCREAADAQLKEAGSVSFVEPGTMAIFLGGVAAKFAIDVFKDFVKEQVIKIIR